MSVSLYIDVWGTYFRQILSDDWISQIKNNCGCKFDECVVLVNDIPVELANECDKMLSDRIADESVSKWLVTSDLESESLSSYGLSKEDFSAVPYASIADLVAIRDCKSEHIVYFAGDCAPWGRSNWVSEGVEILNSNKNFMIVNPTWNGFYGHSRHENHAEFPEYYLGFGFSDGCYLARTSDLAADIYKETNSVSESVYCKSHGNTFEKRVNAYMRNHGKLRVTLKNSAYITRP